MKYLSRIKIYLGIAVIIASIFFGSCANQGSGPTGGPRDSIAPVILYISPRFNATNVSEKLITIEFDEYVVTSSLAQDLVISPPLAEDPTIKNKGKGLTIRINEDLIPDRTYSFDFKDGIKDFNEGNPIENFRLRFSTGDILDTMVIAGTIIDAATMLAVEDVMVGAYTILDDSVITTLKPDFIAITDIDGQFVFDNLPHGDYRVFALIDGNKDMLYSQPSEEVAFMDSSVTVDAEYIFHPDTLIVGEDTTISNGYTEFFPSDLRLLLFQQEVYNQYLTSFSRVQPNKIEMLFNETLTDSFRIELLNDTIADWSYVEFGQKRDSVGIWITDSTIIALDTLRLALYYSMMNDSLKTYYTYADTIRFLTQTAKPKGKKSSEEVEPKSYAFKIGSNVKGTFNYNNVVQLVSEYPIENLQDTSIHYYEVVNDTTLNPIKFSFKQRENSLRKFILKANLQPETKYKIEIDSAAVYSLSNVPNNTVSIDFTTQKSDYYGNIIMELSGFNSEGILMLLSGNKNEDIIRKTAINAKLKEVTFANIEPGKYMLKIVDDTNLNGEWDTGNLEEKLQPEHIYYFPKLISVKSNWDFKETWEVKMNDIQVKNIVDPDAKEIDSDDKRGMAGGR